MKKMLLIGAMLIVGATSFGQRVADLGAADSSPKTGGTKLDITVRGEVVDSNKNILVITPLTNAGADDNTIVFNFGTMALGSSSTLTGKFKAEVFKSRNHKDPISLTGSTIKVGIGKTADDADTSQSKVKLTLLSIENNGSGTTGKDLGDLTYELSTGSTSNNGLVNADKTYEGVVTATVTMDASNTGNFYNSQGKLNVEISGISNLNQ